ncbi:MAG: hypothetical protein EGQ34_07455 [Sutterella sp.]|nr:hypothetical protein [Sutterella sp.]
MEGPLSWRDIIEGAGLTGPLKSLASQSQVISLTDARVQLRLGVQSLLTEQNKKLLEERISVWLGRAFRVEFLAGTVEAGSTVADAERRKKEAERRELIEKFKSDPVVKEIVRLFNGKIDEDSIRPLTPEEMAEKN